MEEIILKTGEKLNIENILYNAKQINDKSEIEDIEKCIKDLKKVIHYIDIRIDNVSETPIRYSSKEGYERAKRSINGTLTILSDIRYNYNRILGRVESIYYRKKRSSYKLHSQKAMNKGGVYTDADKSWLCNGYIGRKKSHSAIGGVTL
jgi:hypothetical protein